MSTSTDMAAPPGSEPASPARRFRASLLIAMMICISGVTGIILLIAERNAQAGYQEAIEQKFKARIAYGIGLHEGLLTAIEERCRILARSVRIRAALEEDDLRDLYENALAEMPDILDARARDGRPPALHANFVRFLNASGTVLSPSTNEPGAGLAPWERALAPFASGRSAQLRGYLAVPAPGGGPALNEVIGTPVIDAASGRYLGSMVLGFPPAELDAATSGDMVAGVATVGSFFAASGRSPKLAAVVSPALAASRDETGSFPASVDGVPNLVFYKLLNPGSPMPKAWQVCVYSLADSLARQAALRWEILGAGLAVLLAGLGASHLLSTRLARPVEAIALDSAANKAGRRAAEAALELTEQRYRSIFENALEGIFVMSPHGRHLSVNPAMARMFGYGSAGGLIAKWDGANHVDPARQGDFLAAVLRDGIAADWEMEMTRRDGRRLWVWQSAHTVCDAAGAVACIEGTMLDVTERKLAADDLRAVNQELARAMETLQATQQHVIEQERLRALGQMASGIAHDFNNALMPISGFSEMLMCDPALLDDRETTQQYLGFIHTAARDAGSVVARLREFYRPNEHTDLFGPVMLNRVVKQAANLTRPKWKDQAQASGIVVEVRMDLQDRLPVNADESAMRELLTNLVFNAVDAMPAGGAVSLRTRCEAGCGVLEVADSGTGMTEEVRRRCMDPFFSTKGERGTGLGLAMVFGIVQRHQGSIHIESEPGAGTTFIIRLPLHQEEAGAGDTAGRVLATRHLQILVVDDEPQVRTVVSALLNAEGHVCETASHALDGIQRFRERHFDLVIADRAMPGMSGDQMAHSIKQITPGVPFVLLTGFGSFITHDETPGVDVIASKPITRVGLRDAIGKAMKVA